MSEQVLRSTSTDEPHVFRLTPEIWLRDHPGYMWIELPTSGFLGGSSRALSCSRCGALTVVPEVHDLWHEDSA